MSSKGKLWRNSFGSHKEQAQAKLEGNKPKVKLPFNIDIAMDKHLTTDNSNLAIVFPNNQNFILAYDIDSKSEDLYEVILASNILKYTLENMEFNPLIYLSGAKGVHIEVRFNTKVDNAKLKKLSDLVKSIAESKGCLYIDRCYPSRAAYRMFGCKHYSSKEFTGIIKDIIVLNENDSWVEFEKYYKVGCMGNTEAKVDQAIKQSIKPSKTGVLTKKKPSIKEKKPPARSLIKESVKYSINDIEQVYTKGLYGDYTRYLTSFAMGRYFREVLGLTADQARAECEQWLKRHYPDFALEYFGDHVSDKIKTPFYSCIKETVENCMNGYNKGQSFKPRVILKFSKYKTEKYVDGLKLSKPQKVALRYMIRVAEQYNSLIFYHSYEQLSKGFKCNVSTVPAWISKFIELEAISIISKGKYAVNGINYATFYELTVPSTTYEITASNMETVAEPAMEALENAAYPQVGMVGT